MDVTLQLCINGDRSRLTTCGERTVPASIPSNHLCDRELTEGIRFPREPISSVDTQYWLQMLAEHRADWFWGLPQSVDADFVHGRDRHRVDRRAGVGACAVGVEGFAAPRSQHGLRHLTAHSVFGADEQHFPFHDRN